MGREGCQLARMRATGEGVGCACGGGGGVGGGGERGQLTWGCVLRTVAAMALLIAMMRSSTSLSSTCFGRGAWGDRARDMGLRATGYGLRARAAAAAAAALGKGWVVLA